MVELDDLDRRSGPTRRPASRSALAPLEPFSPTAWADEIPPPYDWIVDGCFLRGTVGMVSGDGGLGKSLLMQMLATSTALGRPWLGLATKRARSLLVACEDDMDELHRRQHAICRAYGCEPADLGAMHLVSRVGEDSLLMEFDRRTDAPKRLPFFDQVREHALDLGIEVLIFDTVADVFGGNEIVRNQVRRFIGEHRRLAIEMQGTVILTAHPSNTGISTGTGVSGSTGWNNAVRSRVYLTRPRPIEGEEEDTDERVLRTMKNNHAASGGRIKLRWKDGVFVVDDGPGPLDKVDRIEVDRLLLDGLRTLLNAGTMVSAEIAARTGFATLVRALPACKHLAYSVVVGAQGRLIDGGKVVKVELGPRSKRRLYLRTPETLLPGEATGETT